jgi:uncharacterized protein DUF1360
VPAGLASDKRKVFGVVAMFSFAGLCACAGFIINWYGEFEIEKIGAYELVLLGLACLRLIHLITYDKILEPMREYLAYGEGLTRLLSDFISCVWCTGMWSAVIVTTIHFLGRWGRLAVLMLAVAGLGALLQVVSRAVAGCAVEPQK